MTYKVSFQLYSARHFPPIESQLPYLKEIGYDAVEPWPPAYVDKAGELRRMLDDNGLACYGFHMPIAGLLDETARYADFAQALGATSMIPSSIPVDQRSSDPGEWRRLAHGLAEKADEVAPLGLKVAWHNHAFEYAPLTDGSRGIDILLGESGPNVGWEVDFAWIVRGGADPAAELERYAKRVTIIQTKDTAPLGTEQDGGWTATGDGIVDWDALVPLFATTMADHLVTEHDNPSDWKDLALRSLRKVREYGLA